MGPETRREFNRIKSEWESVKPEFAEVEDIQFLLEVVDKYRRVVGILLDDCRISEEHAAEFDDEPSIYVSDVYMALDRVWKE